MPSSLCVVHRLSALDLAVGTPLSVETAYVSLKAVKSALSALEIPLADAFSFKGFRAGRATAMAAAGDSLASILQAGEWRSAAFLHYVSETEIDKQRILQYALEEDIED